MRILHVTPYYVEAWAYGGIPRLARALSEGLARRGHDVTVCTTDARDASSRVPLTSYRTNGVEVHVFPNISNTLAYRLQFFLPRGLNRFLYEHAGRYDVAHLHACRNVPGVIAAHHLQSSSVPFALAPNGTAPLIERRIAAKRVFDWVAGQRVLDGAARVVAVTGAERGDLCRLGVPPAKIRVIPNPVALDEFQTPIPRGVFRGRHGLPGPVILFLGQVTPRKRVDVLVRAFSKLGRADATLVIAGNDMGAAPQARRLVRTLGLESRVLFTGLLRGRDRLEALADADVLVYPSEREIFGLVPLEALLCGTPVIVADDSGSAEVVRATGGGQIVPLGDADALRKAIDAVLGQPGVWRAAAVTAAERVRQLYGDDVVSAEVERMYMDMVGAS